MARLRELLASLPLLIPKREEEKIVGARGGDGERSGLLYPYKSRFIESCRDGRVVGRGDGSFAKISQLYVVWIRPVSDSPIARTRHGFRGILSLVITGCATYTFPRDLYTLGRCGKKLIRTHSSNVVRKDADGIAIRTDFPGQIGVCLHGI